MTRVQGYETADHGRVDRGNDQSCYYRQYSNGQVILACRVVFQVHLLVQMRKA